MAEFFIYENERGGALILRSDGDSFVTDIPALSTVDVSISEAQGVGQVGATATEASIQPKTITVSGAVRNAPARAALLAAVLPGVPARLTMVDGSARRYLEGIPSKSPEISNRRGVQPFQFAFRCSYPYWRGEERPNSLSGLTALFRFPVNLAGTWRISSRSSDVFSTVDHPGNMPASFTLRFSARTQVTNPEVYHLESGSFIRLITTMEIGDTIEVSTVYGSKGAWLISEDGVSTNVFRLLDIDSDLSMQLRPGVNTFRVEADAGKDGLDVTLFAPKGVWAGV